MPRNRTHAAMHAAPHASRPAHHAPRIAITALLESWNGARRVRLNAAYVDAAERAGLIPLVTPPLPPESAGSVLDAVDGVLLTGGVDVDPARYGQTPVPELGEVQPERDAWEIALVLEARARGMPVLAICRGVQVLNVALGGTLVQDIATQIPGALAHAESTARNSRVHALTVEPGSGLAAALGATRLTVNSLHHQSIDAVATGIRVTARADDQVIEGIESASADWWMLGAQWHPEELTDTPEGWDRGLFAAFAARLGAR